MADLQILKTELDTDPDGRGYSGMSHEEAAADLNIERVSRNRTSMPGAEAYDLTDSGEYTALSDAAKSQWLSLCAIGSVDPFGPAAQAVVDIFGNPSATTSNLQAARVETVSQGVNIEFGYTEAGDVQQARLLP